MDRWWYWWGFWMNHSLDHDNNIMKKVFLIFISEMRKLSINRGWVTSLRLLGCGGGIKPNLSHYNYNYSWPQLYVILFTTFQNNDKTTAWLHDKIVQTRQLHAITNKYVFLKLYFLFSLEYSLKNIKYKKCNNLVKVFWAYISIVKCDLVSASFVSG